MQESDSYGFERVFRRLCAGYDTPPTDERKAAYWRSFRKLSLIEFAGLVDLALVHSQFVSMPTVGALWELHTTAQAKSSPAPAQLIGPTLQEQLCAWVTPRAFAMVQRGEMTHREFSGTWSYTYREWTDTNRERHLQRCAECTGVVIELEDGRKLGWTVAEMQAPEFDSDPPLSPNSSAGAYA